MLVPLGCGGGGGGISLIAATTCSQNFVACGGDPTGTWDIVSLCVDGDLNAAVNDQVAENDPACADLVSNAKLSGSGSVTYGAGTVSYNGRFQVQFAASYTPACVSALAGGASLNAAVCGQIQTNLNKEEGKAGTCSFTGENCVCQFTMSPPITRSYSYTVSGATISEVGSDSYSFCVNGNTMTQREQIAGDAYGVTQLKKR